MLQPTVPLPRSRRAARRPRGDSGRASSASCTRSGPRRRLEPAAELRRTKAAEEDRVTEALAVAIVEKRRRLQERVQNEAEHESTVEGKREALEPPLNEFGQTTLRWRRLCGSTSSLWKPWHGRKSAAWRHTR